MRLRFIARMKNFDANNKFDELYKHYYFLQQSFSQSQQILVKIQTSLTRDHITNTQRELTSQFRCPCLSFCTIALQYKHLINDPNVQISMNKCIFIITNTKVDIRQKGQALSGIHVLFKHQFFMQSSYISEWQFLKGSLQLRITISRKGNFT
ncbi:unnamed protein product [Paramecium octaurelia]|uniref:Uncharacterized protein n=1 Tax=Paramecium octaurelia TaxID=43137 RepID=A0A8S1WRN4_PAROT|nr:unnamed protein product [Paramecium octaurelia]